MAVYFNFFVCFAIFRDFQYFAYFQVFFSKIWGGCFFLMFFFWITKIHGSNKSSLWISSRDLTGLSLICWHLFFLTTEFFSSMVGKKLKRSKHFFIKLRRQILSCKNFCELKRNCIFIPSLFSFAFLRIPQFWSYLTLEVL